MFIGLCVIIMLFGIALYDISVCMDSKFKSLLEVIFTVVYPIIAIIAIVDVII